MFEKEANEYAKENKRVYCSDEYAYITDYTNVKKAFQKGADCGYNKANEWHSVYDELPKENKKYWVLTSDGEPKVADWLSVSWVSSYDIVAWKEIVKPKGVAE